jgi:hypothetical protein
MKQNTILKPLDKFKDEIFEIEFEGNKYMICCKEVYLGGSNNDLIKGNLSVNKHDEEGVTSEFKLENIILSQHISEFTPSLNDRLCVEYGAYITSECSTILFRPITEKYTSIQTKIKKIQ